MKRRFLGNVLGVLGAYSILTYLMVMNWETYKHIHVMMLLGYLSMFFLLGSLLYKKYHLGAVLLGIFIPHVVADTLYVVGLNMKSTEIGSWFEKLVPQVYGNLQLTRLLPYDKITPSMQIIIVTAVVIPLCYLSFLVGIKLRASVRQVSKWMYNNLMIWGIHYLLFIVFTNIATQYFAILIDQKVKLYFAVGATCILFISYFFAGKWCHTLKYSIFQITSMISVSLTALGLYVGYLFHITDAGVYERYMLPVATSFIGIICQRIGVMTGARAVVSSQYGLLATGIMISVPTILFVIGRYTSLPEKKQYEHGPRLKLPKIK